jgi:predicted permease
MSLVYVAIKILSMYLYIVLGFIYKKYSKLPSNIIANLLYYIFVPMIVFKSSATANIFNFFMLALLSFCMSLIISIIIFKISNKINMPIEKGLTQCIYAQFNIGWFGIPITYILFGEKWAEIMTAFYIGGMLFGNTIGYLLIAKTKNNIRSIITTLCKIPSIYAILLGFILQYLSINIFNESSVVLNYSFQLASMATSILGMVLIGISIANISIGSINWQKIFFLQLSRLLIALIVVIPLGYLFYFYHLINIDGLKVAILLPMLPIAANIIVFNTKLNGNNSFLGLNMVASTFLSLLYIAIMLIFYK